jgi:hypothetical protein
MTIWNYGGKPNNISLDQAITYAKQAGFTGQGLVNAVAIAMAESGLNGNSVNNTTSGVGVDRGIVKFNSVYHRDVSDACAYNPACAFREFYRVSQGGTNFCQWCTFNAGCARNCNSNGPYRSNIAQVQAAISSNKTGTVAPPTTTGNILGLPDFKQIGEYTGIFILSVALIILGFYLLMEKQIASVAHKGMDAALKLTL